MKGTLWEEKGGEYVKKKIIAGMVMLAVVAAIGAVAYRTTAQESEGDQLLVPPTKFVYAAKFVCGVMKVNPTFKGEMPVKPANYATAINLHNPQNNRVVMLKKVVEALPEPDQGEPKIIAQEFVLRPDWATEADCNEIYRALGKNPAQKPFVKGFFVIESLQELDVVGVYTASAPGASPMGTSIAEDIEYIQPHVVPLISPI